MRRTGSALAALSGLTLLATACGYHPDSTVVHLGDPGKCVAVDVAATPETAPLLSASASRFNGSPAARLVDGKCAFVRVQTVDSPEALHALSTGWTDTERLGPAPIAWVPGSTMWGELLNHRLAARHRRPMAPNGTPFARTPLVLAMPAPMAHALDYPRRAVGWRDIEQLSRDPRGWGAYGHPEWGSFRLGKGNPYWSTSGLDATIAVDASPTAAADARLLEQSVVYYGDTTEVYFDNWKRLSAKSTASALTYLSAAITDERSVVAYNTGHTATDDSITGTAARPSLPLVAVYPNDATVESDNPVIVLDAPWSTSSAREGARAFTTFALQSATQTKVAAAGFRPARGAVRADLLGARNGIDPATHATPVEPSSPAAIERTLARWQTIRRRANVLILFDASDSMGDAVKTQGPTKLALAQAALMDALDQFGPADDVGLRIFSTELANPVSPNWRDVVPIGPFSSGHRALQTAISSLTPHRGSPLYAATRDAFDAVARRLDPQAINAVVLLTDGYNEDGHDNRSALLAHLATNPSVHVFTIAYSDQADAATMKKIAQATNAATYDATVETDLADLLPRALAGL